MNKRTAPIWFACLVVTFALVSLSGCRKEGADQGATGKTDEPVAVTISAEQAADVEAKLAKADAFDGKTDKVVSKCASCALQMEGNPENALVVAGYTMHFCSPSCKTRFGADAEKLILALKVSDTGHGEE